MDIASLTAIARRDFLNDNVSPYTWSNDFFLKSFSEAHRQACNRCNFLFADNLYFTLRSGIASYQLPENLTKLLYLTYDGEDIEKIYHEQLPRDWRKHTGFIENERKYFVRGNLVTFYPKPTDIDKGAKVYIEGYITPIEDFTSFSDEPLIPQEHHKALIHWVCHEAYSNEVTNADYMDAKDSQKSQEQLALFNAHFGKPITASVKQHLFSSQG